MQDAYTAALERDTLQTYEDFLAAYPDDPLTGRVRAILAARREAITWRRSYRADTPDAYWSYLRRYPRGPHAGDARRRLAILTAPPDPPPSFAMMDYDVPPPPPDEAGLKTRIIAVPPLAMSAAAMAARNSVADTKVVGRSCPLTRTTDACTNPVPVMVRLKAGPPAVTLAGFKAVIAGTGTGA